LNLLHHAADDGTPKQPSISCSRIVGNSRPCNEPFDALDHVASCFGSSEKHTCCCMTVNGYSGVETTGHTSHSDVSYDVDDTYPNDPSSGNLGYRNAICKSLVETNDHTIGNVSSFAASSCEDAFVPSCRPSGFSARTELSYKLTYPLVIWISSSFCAMFSTSRYW
jgi:hypothetical protein